MPITIRIGDGSGNVFVFEMTCEEVYHPASGQFVPTESVKADTELSDPPQTVIEGEFGGGVVKAELLKEILCPDRWRASFDQAVKLTGKDGKAELLRFDRHDKIAGITAKDIDGDGDLDITVVPSEAKNGAIVYYNLTAGSQGDKRLIEETLERSLRRLFSGKYSPFDYEELIHSTKAYLRSHSYDSFGALMFGTVPNDKEFFQPQLSEPKRIFDILVKELGTEGIGLRDAFVPFLNKCLGEHDVDAFLFGLDIFGANASALLLRELDPQKIGELFCSQWSDAVSFENTLLELDRIDTATAGKISRELSCRNSMHMNRFPMPGYKGFLDWFRAVGPYRAAEYLNYLLNNDPKRWDVILNGLKDNAGYKKLQNSDDIEFKHILALLAGNGLSQEGMKAAGIHGFMDRALLNAIGKGRTEALVEADPGYLMDFFNRHQLTPEQTAVLIGPLLEFDRTEFPYEILNSEKGNAYFKDVITSLHKRSPDVAAKFVHIMCKTNFDHEKRGYHHNDRVLTVMMSQENPVVVYQIIKDLPKEVLTDVLGVTKNKYLFGFESRLEEFKSKSAFLVKLEADRPELFPDILRRVKGPFIGSGVTPKAAAKKIKEFVKNVGFSAKIIAEIFNSTYLPGDYLWAVVKELGRSWQRHLLGRSSEQIVNYPLLKMAGQVPLKSDPIGVRKYIGKNTYNLDEEAFNEIAQDADALTTAEFLNLVEVFKLGAEDDRLLYLLATGNSDAPWDSTGFGWLYRNIKDPSKKAVLEGRSDGYFRSVGLLRERFGLDMDLYLNGPFDAPLTDEELAPIAAAFKKFPAEKLDSINGLTIVDDIGGRNVLGIHDEFGNIVIYRRYTPHGKGVRIENADFLEEIIVHENWHGNEKDLSIEEFELYARCAGYQRTSLYSPAYEISEGREMVSTYHTDIHEEFAESGTNYELNPSEFRKRALAQLDKGDVYLALEYLFFKHIPEESRGREYPPDKDVPNDERIDIKTVQDRIDRLEKGNVIPAKKADWVRALLKEIAKTASF